jgi:hypothetical protein
MNISKSRKKENTLEEKRVIYEKDAWVSEVYRKKYGRFLREIYDATKILKISIKTAIVSF